MWTYFFMFLSLVAGTFTGMGCTLLLLAVNTEDRKPKDDRPPQSQKGSLPEPDVPEDEPEEFDIPLTRKIPPKEFSMTEFNCGVDGKEADAHIATQQQQQDNAYNTLKRR